MHVHSLFHHCMLTTYKQSKIAANQASELIRSHYNCNTSNTLEAENRILTTQPSNHIWPLEHLRAEQICPIPMYPRTWTGPCMHIRVWLRGCGLIKWWISLCMQFLTCPIGLYQIEWIHLGHVLNHLPASHDHQWSRQQWSFTTCTCIQAYSGMK